MRIRLLTASVLVTSAALALTACGSQGGITELELPEPTTSQPESPSVGETPDPNLAPSEQPPQGAADPEPSPEPAPEPQEEQGLTAEGLTVELSKDLDGNGVLVTPLQVMVFTDLESKDAYRIEFSNPDIMLLSEARPEDDIKENEFFTPTYSVQATEPGTSTVSVIKESDDSVYYEIRVEATNNGFALDTTDSDPSEWEPVLIYPDMLQLTLLKGQRAAFAFEAEDVDYDPAYLDLSTDLQTVTALKVGRSVMQITYADGGIEKETSVVVAPIKDVNLRTLTLIDDLINGRTPTKEAVEVLESAGAAVVVVESEPSAQDLDENTFYLVERQGVVVAGGK